MAKGRRGFVVKPNAGCCNESFVGKMIRLGLMQNINPTDFKYLLCENSFFLVQENGDKIKLEQSI